MTPNPPPCDISALLVSCCIDPSLGAAGATGICLGNEPASCSLPMFGIEASNLESKSAFWNTVRWFIDHFEAEGRWRGAVNARIAGAPKFLIITKGENGIWIQTLPKMGRSPAQMKVHSLVFMMCFPEDIYQPLILMMTNHTCTQNCVDVRHVLYSPCEEYIKCVCILPNSPRPDLHLRFCPTGGNSEPADLRRFQDQWCHEKELEINHG